MPSNLPNQANSRGSRTKTVNSTSQLDTAEAVSDDDVPVPCTSCGKMVIDKGLQCGFCENWYCPQCTGLKTAVLKNLVDTPDCLLWFCKSCIITFPGVKKLLTRITACEAKNTEIANRVTELESKEKALSNKNEQLEYKIDKLVEKSKTIEKIESSES